jgi:magnesium-protoporphyrin O-methyltransferase
MTRASYVQRRGEIEAYFDRTAVQAWAKLTSDAPVSGIRATVRAGRQSMRELLVQWLISHGTAGVHPLLGRRVLDAGCGTGLLAVDAARQGAAVVGIDLSPTLVDLARERLPDDLLPGSVELCAGDMLDESLGSFDHLVAMDSLIHYAPQQAVSALMVLAPRIRHSMLFTFAPGNPLLMGMMAVGRLFPRGDRSPSIVPVPPHRLVALLEQSLGPLGWRVGRTQRISRGFYTSQALELTRA